MQLNTKSKGKEVVISVSGDVDLYTSPDLRKAIAKLAKKKADPLVIDLDGVDYMDSSGVATLVEGLQLTARYDGSFRIASLKEGVREVFELARLDKVFDVYENTEKALAES
ncbi:MAG: STAS domain-containing protein [Candidatus Glassbacteria bacterium]|nr:STAS domain-containing protein [Candidatus Glassbacteria bacterium]